MSAANSIPQLQFVAYSICRELSKRALEIFCLTREGSMKALGEVTGLIKSVGHRHPWTRSLQFRTVVETTFFA